MKKTILTLVTLALLTVTAQANQLFVKTVALSMDDVDMSLEYSFDKNKLKTVENVDVLPKMIKSGLPAKMGEKWNTNKLTGLKALIVCNGKIGMTIANIDPVYAAACPIKITLIERDGKTTITYVKSSGTTDNKELEVALKALDDKVIKAITEAEYKAEK